MSALRSTTEEASAHRWGAAVLAVCMTTFIVTMILYVTAFGQPASARGDGVITPVDRAAHVLDKWPLISRLWLVESLAWVLLAIAAFTLQDRRASGPAWLPSRAAWLSIGVGAVVQSIMYALTLGAYPAAATNAAALPDLFDAFARSAFVLFYLGNAFVFLGLAGIFVGEAGAAGVIRRSVAAVAAVVSIAATILLVALLAGFGQMMYVAPAAFAAYLATIYLAVAIWRRG